MEAELANEIKSFRKLFRKQNGRDPSRKDMAKHPEIRATYETWLALKSGNSSIGGGSGAHRDPPLKRTNGVLSDAPSESQGQEDMPPPPVTPKKKAKMADAFTTPVRSGVQDRDMLSTVNDSGGSIVDVPTTPKRESSRTGDHEGDTLTPGTPQQRRRGYADDFDDGTSPSKLRTLIASFAATRSRLTPPPSARQGDDGGGDDSRLRRDLRASTKAHAGAPQNGSMFTPRTKARKRLRGEVVVTPAKPSMTDGLLGGNLKAATAGARPAKKQRGMATLKGFGFAAVARKKSNGLGSGKAKQHALSEEEEEDDDLVGPSPSSNRVVSLPLGSFQPLFDQSLAVEAGESDEEEGDEEYVPLRSSQSAMVDQTDTAVTTPPALLEAMDGNDSDEEERRHIRPYRRYDSRLAAVDADAAEEEEAFGFGGDALLSRRVYPVASHGQRLGTPPSLQGNGAESGNDDDDLSIDKLTLRSPQCKRAQRQRRRRQAENVRKLLTTNGIDPIDSEEDDTAAKQADGNKPPPIAHGNAKTARMMRGTLTKAARKALAIAQESEQVTAIDSKAPTDSAGPERRSEPCGPRLILRRGREEEEENEEGSGGEEGLDGPDRADGSDDEWASDVDSAEYGLGDGYMEEVDVM